ncbi:phosphotransferase [Terribacillus saccharophilus]|uniref:Phosphotransferase n=1 Tax=Terribacillus saccharophilus TaxID=361277 RepID=A0A268H8K7_9BACI|nr:MULTISPECIES: phosphotransferase family protein [Terribacillus]PAE06205.1 phosphotransferase [Terribacillus saccharophilus]
MNWLEHILGNEWKIAPAGGVTGEAYYAKSGDRQLFLKRNSSPFLAVLSAEGIVPKLVWTKRMENGDVITAQEWLMGRGLTFSEMSDPRVAKLLSKIHHSSEMLNLLMRMGKKPLQPEAKMEELRGKAAGFQDRLPALKQVLASLEQFLPEMPDQLLAVCHFDIDHNNWMISQCDELYLVDWDSALIADPAADIGMLLRKYVPYTDWEDWMKAYGKPLNNALLRRIYWYEAARIIMSLRDDNVERKSKELEQLLKEVHQLSC